MSARDIIIYGLAVVVGGCLDLELLDDMEPLDAGTAEGDGTDATDTGGEGPPATDPDDEAPPELVATACGTGERADGALCVSEGPVSAAVRFTTDEPAVVGLELPDGAQGGVLSTPWSTAHHLAFGGLDPAGANPVTLSFEDVNGNEDAVGVDLVPTGGPAIAITEVLADPNGPEPAQEFVEIANVGAAEVDLSGWMIDDNADADGDLLPTGTCLGPGAAALLVADDFDHTDGADPAPAAGALVIALESSIGSSGLKNSEAESVELYDADGQLVSMYGGQAGSPKEGRSAARIRAELPDGDALAWELDPSGASSPGTAPLLE
jgi:hypothetical protein